MYEQRNIDCNEMIYYKEFFTHNQIKCKSIVNQVKII